MTKRISYDEIARWRDWPELHAKAAIPRLLDELTRLRAENDAADRRIKELEAREHARLSAIAASGPIADSAHSRATHVAGPEAEVFGEDCDD